MHKTAMTEMFRVAVKTHRGANGISSPLSAPFLEIQKYPLLLHYMKERGEKKKGEKNKKEMVKCK